MNYATALERIIHDGIEAAMRDYAGEARTQKRAGAVQGFEDCRGKTPEEISELLIDAHQKVTYARDKVPGQYWYWRCREAEIEWVANVVSCILDAQGLPPIAPMTARGMLKAAEIIGVKKTQRA